MGKKLCVLDMRILGFPDCANQHQHWLSPILNRSMRIDEDLRICLKIYDILMNGFSPKSPRLQKAMEIDGDLAK